MVVAHTDEIPFRCDVCDCNFLFKSDYDVHIKRKKHLKGLHLQKRGKLSINRSRLQCEFCDLLFKNDRLLKGQAAAKQQLHISLLMMNVSYLMTILKKY